MARGATILTPWTPRATLHAITAVTILLTYTQPARAQSSLSPQSQGHARFHAEFYSHLRIPGTQTSCCNNQDCRPIKYRITTKGVLFYVNGAWFEPPKDRLIQMSTPDGGAHWCGIAFKGAPPHTYCAVIPPSAS